MCVFWEVVGVGGDGERMDRLTLFRILSHLPQPDTSAPEPEDKLNTRETIRLSLIFCIVWFIANYTTNASLAYTTVGSSTILSSTSGNSDERIKTYSMTHSPIPTHRPIYLGYWLPVRR